MTDFSNMKKVIEPLNQGGSWLFLWWQKLRPAWQGMNKLFFFTDFHVLWLSFLVLSSAHDYVSFQGWWSCSSGKPYYLGYSGSVSPVLIGGQDRRNAGFASPFLAAPLLFAPTYFPFLFLHQSGCCLPCLLALPSSLPVFSLFSPSANSTDGWWLQQHAQAYLPSSWRKLSKHWFVKGELLLFNNRHQAKQKEIGIDFLHISTQYFA